MVLISPRMKPPWMRVVGRLLCWGRAIDVLYPSEHRAIANRMTLNGAVITEFPPKTKPERGNFPARNRIISGFELRYGGGGSTVTEWGVEHSGIFTKTRA